MVQQATKTVGEMSEQELRGRILLEMVGACSFVDDCKKHCNPSDQEDCYGIAAGNIIVTIKGVKLEGKGK